jgi:hypothetical protein
MIQTLIPPQPTPQQFNYTPGSTEATQNAPAQTPTVLQQVMAATQSAQPVQSQQPTPQSGAQTNGKPTPK